MSNDKKLVRKADGSMVAGIAAGLGEYFGLDVTLLRVLFVVFTIFGGAGLIIYIVMWILVPKEGTGTSVAEDVVGGVEADDDDAREEE